MVSTQGILPSTTNVMPVPSKARDFVSQGRVHLSPHCCLTFVNSYMQGSQGREWGDKGYASALP